MGASKAIWEKWVSPQADVQLGFPKTGSLGVRCGIVQPSTLVGVGVGVEKSI